MNAYLREPVVDDVSAYTAGQDANCSKMQVRETERFANRNFPVYERLFMHFMRAIGR
ncbi:hypothetical protein KS4_28840 [Poriferisphaera corsica]|uniref:Uncharacterized protein n=1 Tax=Poriferisphaera corsica TaxID=2528020 RepID=A0A517YX55_9BACT|nr:hypothetical protein KS4_28840 [Poriferisphaera corsica]